MIWKCSEILWRIIEFSCLTDINISRKIKKKMMIYGPFLRKLQILYPEYKYEMIPIVAGGFGYVPKCLTRF